MEKAPTILLEGLTEAEEDEIMIRDNTHNGKWDTDMLRAWKNEDLEKWAAPKWQEFSQEDIDGLFQEHTPAPKPIYIVVEIPPQIESEPIKEAVSKAVSEWPDIRVK